MRAFFPILVAGICLGSSAQASMGVTQWYNGTWNCTIDGRPSVMRWRYVNDSQQTCSGGVCTSSSGVALRGSFSDNGSPFVRLTKISSNSTVLVMRHPDGNRWRLDMSVPGRAAGYTTWNGQRYPLVCNRRSMN